MVMEFGFLPLNFTSLLQGGEMETYNIFSAAATLLVLAVVYISAKRKHVYLIDFVCYRPPNEFRVPLSTLHESIILSKEFNEESILFQTKNLQRSGIGNETSMPPSTHCHPHDHSMATAREEVDTILCTIVKDLFDKHNINPKSIDILVANCSTFSPTPSIPALIINRFGMKSNLMSFNLSGMGCSAGILSLTLARDLLRVHKNSLALVLSIETITPNGYLGKDKSMLLTNCLFRMGGAAILLGNRSQDKKKSKYVLQYLVRTHTGRDDNSYRCIFQRPDSDGCVGISLSRDVLNVAADALRTNIADLGPLVLPFSEKFQYALSVIRRKVSKGRHPHYVPDFKRAFEHFCIHAGGKAVIDSVEKNLSLTPQQAEPSKMTLYRFGNTSSSSVWYELAYIEAIGRMRKGDRVWQIAFGSGFKCNSAVWKCISEFKGEENNAWSDRISDYPVKIPRILDY